jgi:hypothetical protein
MQSHPMSGLTGHANEDTCDRKASGETVFSFHGFATAKSNKASCRLFGLFSMFRESFFSFPFLSCL